MAAGERGSGLDAIETLSQTRRGWWVWERRRREREGEVLKLRRFHKYCEFGPPRQRLSIAVGASTDVQRIPAVG